METKETTSDPGQEVIEYVDEELYANASDAYFDFDMDIASEALDEMGGFRFPLLVLHSQDETYQIFRPSEDQTEADFLLKFSNSNLVTTHRTPAISYLTLRCLPKRLAKILFPVDRFHYYGALVLCFNISNEGSYLNIFAPVQEEEYHTLHVDGLGLAINDELVFATFGKKAAPFKKLASKVDSRFSRFTKKANEMGSNSKSGSIPNNLVKLSAFHLDRKISGQGRATTDNLEGEEVPS